MANIVGLSTTLESRFQIGGLPLVLSVGECTELLSAATCAIRWSQMVQLEALTTALVHHVVVGRTHGRLL